MKRFAFALSLLAFPAQAGEPDCAAMREMLSAQFAAVETIKPQMERLINSSVVLFANGDGDSANALTDTAGETFGALKEMLNRSVTIMDEAGCLSD